MAETKRIAVFDNIKFLLIVLVIYCHLRNIGCAIPWPLYRVIYSFHMPFFVLLSGYFTSKGKEPRKFWNSNLNLFLLFLIFSAVSALVNVFVYDKAPFTNFYTPPFALWYLLCMIYWRVAVYYIPEKVLKSPWFIALSFALSVVPVLIDVNYFSFARCLAFFPYFLLGWICRENHFEKTLDNASSKWKWILLAGTFVCCIIAVFLPEDLFWARLPFGASVPKTVLYKVLSWPIALMIPVGVYILMPKNKGIDEGRYTLFYYLFHTILLFPVFDLIVKHLPKNYVVTVIVLVLIVGIIFLLRKIPFLDKMMGIGKNGFGKKMENPQLQ